MKRRGKIRIKEKREKKNEKERKKKTDETRELKKNNNKKDFKKKYKERINDLGKETKKHQVTRRKIEKPTKFNKKTTNWRKKEKIDKKYKTENRMKGGKEHDKAELLMLT